MLVYLALFWDVQTLTVPTHEKVEIALQILVCQGVFWEEWIGNAVKKLSVLSTKLRVRAGRCWVPLAKWCTWRFKRQAFMGKKPAPHILRLMSDSGNSTRNLSIPLAILLWIHKTKLINMFQICFLICSNSVFTSFDHLTGWRLMGMPFFKSTLAPLNPYDLNWCIAGAGALSFPPPCASEASVRGPCLGTAK